MTRQEQLRSGTVPPSMRGYEFTAPDIGALELGLLTHLIQDYPLQVFRGLFRHTPGPEFADARLGAPDARPHNLEVEQGITVFDRLLGILKDTKFPPHVHIVLLATGTVHLPQEELERLYLTLRPAKRPSNEVLSATAPGMIFARRAVEHHDVLSAILSHKDYHDHAIAHPDMLLEWSRRLAQIPLPVTWNSINMLAELLPESLQGDLAEHIRTHTPINTGEDPSEKALAAAGRLTTA